MFETLNEEAIKFLLLGATILSSTVATIVSSNTTPQNNNITDTKRPDPYRMFDDLDNRVAVIVNREDKNYPYNHKLKAKITSGKFVGLERGGGWQTQENAIYFAFHIAFCEEVYVYCNNRFIKMNKPEKIGSANNNNHSLVLKPQKINKK